MSYYWELDGVIVAKKESSKEVVDVLEKYGTDIDEKENKKIWFSFRDNASYSMPHDLDNDLRPLVEDGEFTAHLDDEHRTYCYRYGKEPCCEETDVLEYYPSQIEDFVKSLPKRIVDAVLKEYAEPAAKKQELRVQTPAGPIVAKVMPDEDYPGIIVMNEKEPGQPSAILEYDSTAFEDAKSCMQLCVYDETNPDDEPVAIYQMSEDLRTKENKNV